MAELMTELGADAFDFWLGEWDCEFDGGHAVNTVSREFEGNVLQEDFVVDAPRPWHGMSFSVYNPFDGWRQTWIDESGSYWAFVGCLVDGNPSFATPVPIDGTDEKPARFKRMVFTDITTDGFHWRWESSSDNNPDGSQWSVDWEIDYRRRT